MIYGEMRRGGVHGGGDWAYPHCIWVPSRKENGGTWPFWLKVLDVSIGDTVIHLRGVPPRAAFTGYSRVSVPGYVTTRRPPTPGAWGFAREFVRADLDSFVPFKDPISL